MWWQKEHSDWVLKKGDISRQRNISITKGYLRGEGQKAGRMV
jgi:hypothetical protein